MRKIGLYCLFFAVALCIGGVSWNNLSCIELVSFQCRPLYRGRELKYTQKREQLQFMTVALCIGGVSWNILLTKGKKEHGCRPLYRGRELKYADWENDKAKRKSPSV